MMVEIEENVGLIYKENYGPFKDFPDDKDVVINTDDINMDTWEDYFLGILNIFRDGIELDIVKEKTVLVKFGDTGRYCKLYLQDLFVELNMWYFIIFAGGTIKPYHLTKKGNSIKSSDITKFVNRYFILEYRDKLPFILMNNIIDDALFNWFFVNEFSNYLADSFNLKDSSDLARKHPEYYALLHKDYSGYSIDEVNKIALQDTLRMIEIEEKESKAILGYDHCMANSHRAGTTPVKQIKEGFINIGPKPDGNGDVYSHTINKSYVNGGIGDIADFFVDSALSRTAQILSHTNVGDSGHFARLLGLNNTGSYVSRDIDHCDTRNLIMLTIKSQGHLDKYYDRYYREKPNGVVKFISRKEDNSHLIGKTLYFYSPMTCNSATHGKGFCHRCYGALWVINCLINAGKISAELLSKVLTQILLSAKHILEALVKKTVWVKEFYDYFDMEYNYIVLKNTDDLQDAYIVINPSLIDIDNEEDYGENEENNMREHISMFKVVTKSGEYEIKDNDGRELYISNELNRAIRKYAEPKDNLIYIPMDKLKEDQPIFYIRLLNNELSRLLDKLEAMINKKSVTESFDINGLIQGVIDTAVEGNLDIMGVHCEVILSNQIHNAVDLFTGIDWSNEQAAYKLVTLNEALLNNPSPGVTLMYQYLAKTLYTPLTYRKHGPSFIDMFFMLHPQDYPNTDYAKTYLDSEIEDAVPWRINLNSMVERIEKKADIIADKQLNKLVNQGFKIDMDYLQGKKDYVGTKHD